MTNSLTNRSAAWRKVCECLGSVSAASRRLTLLSLLLFLVGIINAWGTDVAFTFNTSAGLSALGITEPNANATTAIGTVSISPVSIAGAQNGANNPACVFKNQQGTSMDLRLYKYNSGSSKGSSITVSVSGNYKLTGISGLWTSKVAASNGTLSSGSWTPTENTTTTSVEIYNNTTGSKGGTASGCTVITVSYASTSTNYTVGYLVNPTGKATVTLGSTSVASGSTTTATYSNITAGYEFVNWTISGTGASLSSTTANPTTITVGSADVIVTANLQCITPTISAQPAASTTCVVGATPSLSVTAAAGGANLNYQWKQCATVDGSYTNVASGGTSSSYSPSTASAGTTYYKCVVTNAATGCSTNETSNVATIIVSAPTPATITLQNYDGDATTTGYHSGDSFTLPNTNNATCNGKTFVGWSTVAIPTPGSKPNANYYEKGASVTLAAGENKFYAVFAEASGGGGAATYTKVTTISAGTYLMATETATEYTPTSTLAYTGDNGSGKRGGVIGVSISDGVISTKPATALEITVTLGTGDDAGYFAMYDGSKYITQGAKNEFAFVDDISYQWDLNANGQIHQKGTFDNSNDNRIYVDHGNSGSQINLFKPMKVRTEGNNNGSYFYHAYLFKKSSTISYSNYTTNCVNMRTVYLDATEFGDASGAQFGIYSWENADGTNNLLAEEFMTKVTADCRGHIYVGEIPDDHDRLIFLRNSSSATQPVQQGDANFWNKTVDITVPANKDFFVIAAGGTGNAYTGTWDDYTPNYAVTFNKNGAGETTTWPSDQCIENSGKASEPSSPQTMGKTFVGWYQEAEGTNAWVFNTNTVTAATTIYAKWNDVATKTIYLDASSTLSGGNRWDADNVVLFARAYINGTSLGTNVTPDGDGPISSCQPHVYKFIIPGNADYVSFARCTTGTTELPSDWDAQGTPIHNSIRGKEIVANKDHYVVTDWGSATLQNSAFAPTSYTMSFAAGDYGSGDAPANDSKACGVAFTLPSTQVFSRNGYTMDGWSINANGSTNDYNLGGSYTTEANQTFYPHWTEATYSVTLTTNGGTINTGDVTSYTYGTGATLPTDVTKAHATFQGWYASSTFEGERVYSIGTTEYGNKQYYAKWEDVKWTVTWKANGSTVRTDANIVDGNKVASVPSAPSDLTTGSDGCDAEFAGWVLEANDPGALSTSTQTSSPTGLFTDVAGSPTITGNVTFVAIYRQEQ